MLFLKCIVAQLTHVLHSLLDRLLLELHRPWTCSILSQTAVQLGCVDPNMHSS